MGAPRAGAGRSGRVTAGLTYSGSGPRSGGPRSRWAGARARGDPAGGEGEPAAGRRGGEEGAGSQSGSIRFSHHPRRVSEQLGRREERLWLGYSASRRLSARRGLQAHGSRPPRRHDAQEEGEQWPRPAHAHSAARPSPEPREAQARRGGPGRRPELR